MNWTADHIATLTQLWADGMSCSQIAEQMGMGLTRNAIIGKAHRLNLPPRATKVRKPRDDSARRREAQKVITLPTQALMRPMPVLASPKPSGVSIVDATGCKYAIGFDENAPGRHLFCNDAKKDASPWCEHHHSLIHEKPVKAPRKRFKIPTSLLRATG